MMRMGCSHIFFSASSQLTITHTCAAGLTFPGPSIKTGTRETGSTANPPLDRDMNGLTPYPITPIGNFLGVLLALLPLRSGMRISNLAVWGYALWTAMYNFQMFVSTIIWHDNVNIVVPVWCDIGEKKYWLSESY